ncbi:GIY-YIG nuclease family protein [Leptolinea tardivitalis]|uniref:Excinuclease ABC subunit C n=1 Tax=Leptolinea tardivitalis TaxID=229920 RepID=A0A0P6XMT0_9CHLR|nr:GIY-YIG nuclease family protein [Leptolinea tardivitalis]KPL70238.1 excinuclease ABC subunit C [Leptolinea tardivitalis]GAP21784.1 predicted endonuclease containing a URI domain [Leptolinea tardivitalis]
MAFFCYIVECSDGTYYTGWSTDPERRTRTHNAGRGARYTSTRRPVKLVYIEEVESLSAALKRERSLKTLDHQRKRKLANAYKQVCITDKEI